MGWLRELMGLAEPAVAGYGELARRVLVHPEWPAGTQPAARSLAALFSKLDRGIELEWLADREAAQRALALVLGCPIESVRREVTADAEELGTGRLRFDDLPYARPFDLREEALPPGVPAEVLAPARWRRLWWQAPPGSGRTLVGRWLAARGLARFVCARKPAQLRERLGPLPPPGAGLFLELERLDGAELPGELALPAEGVCVAAPGPPPLEGGWQHVCSPPLGPLLHELLGWVAARLPEDGAFEVAAAEAWLAPALASGALPTLGALLGAAGALDARGLRTVRGKSVLQLAEACVNERLEAASGKGSAEAQWLKRFGFAALAKLAESALVSGDQPWAAARTQDEWIALVPAELAKSVDSEWVRWTLGRSGGQSTPRAVERALRDVPPGAYRIVRALVDARLLWERAPGSLAVAPEFLKHAALERAHADLLAHGSALAWGEALLRPHAAPGMLDALYRSIAADDTGALERLAEQELGAQPALVVAAEAALTCLGLRALCGAEVPLDSLESLWNEQLSWLVELPGELPRPRLSCPEPAQHALSQHAVWLLAMLAASEQLGERQGRAHALLRPWHEPSIDRLRPVLDRIHAALAAPELAGCEWALEAFALAGRLLDPGDLTLELASDDDDAPAVPVIPHPLCRPAYVVRALAQGELDGPWLDGLGSHPLELPALEAAGAAQHMAWSRIAHAAWKSWQARRCPESAAALFAPGGAHASRFWPHLPPEVLAVAWPRWVEASEPWPLACFDDGAWSAFVDLFVQRWQRTPSSRVWRDAFERMPLRWLEHALDAAALLKDELPGARPLLEQAWQRLPELLSERLCAHARAGEARAVATLLAAVPATHADAIVQALAGELALRSAQRAVIDVARAWLYARVSTRQGDWRAAYALFAEQEDRLARAERVRSVFDTRASGELR